MLNINELNQICEKLSNKFSIKISIQITSLDKSLNGKFDFKSNKILINNDIDQELAICTVYHEFRHAWQYQNYPDLFIWWMCHYDIYMKYYYTLVNSMEQDAILYGNSHGKNNREDLLKFYSIDDLENLFQNNAFDFVREHLEYLESQRSGN